MNIRINIRENLERLLSQEDSDGDCKITVDDRGSKRFQLLTIDGRSFEVAGTYYLSNLLQELGLAQVARTETALLDSSRLFEPPTERISRLIREDYWDGLTRRIDEDGLRQILSDEKAATADGFNYLYVPSEDALAFEYFTEISTRRPELNLKVVRLPVDITPEYVRNLDGFHGVLALSIVARPDGEYEGLPFVVPGGRFNEMYGWDSYFIALGLLNDGRVDLAKSMVENLIYEITHYGAILNANRTYFLTRSQPPFLTSMGLEVYRRLPEGESNKVWLEAVMGAAIKEYRDAWMGPTRQTSVGLSRYCDSGYGAPPEVEPGHFDVVFQAYADKHKMEPRAFESAYRSGTLDVPELDTYFVHDRAMRESGHDTSYRLEGCCADLVTVDLNALLYKIEIDIASTIDGEFGGTARIGEGEPETSSAWHEAAAKRKELIDRYHWNVDRGMFFDYDYVRGRQTAYVSATTFYPLWAGSASPQQAESVINNALPLLEASGGIVGSTEESRGPITPEHPPRQWDYPHGWAPHQMLVWQGLINYGYQEIALRLAYRWLYTITLNATNYNGTVPEKFDAVTRSHQVFAEYGNVGTKFSYITREGFGWTNASYQIGVGLLPPELRDKLDRLIPPEWIFDRAGPAGV
jgi:alpha,alpha-trehalase